MGEFERCTVSEGVCFGGGVLLEDVGVGSGLEARRIVGVKICGLTSRNGYRYEAGALECAVEKYDGVPVYVNHGVLGERVRRLEDRIGKIVNPRMGEGGLYGDLVYNPGHAHARQFEWEVAHNPARLGLSHVVLARVDRDSGGVIVKEVKAVESVDIVTQPASVQSLFDSEAPEHRVSGSPEGCGSSGVVAGVGEGVVGTGDESGGVILEELRRVRRMLDEYRRREEAARARISLEEELRGVGLDPGELGVEVCEALLSLAGGARAAVLGALAAGRMRGGGASSVYVEAARVGVPVAHGAGRCGPLLTAEAFARALRRGHMEIRG